LEIRAGAAPAEQARGRRRAAADSDKVAVPAAIAPAVPAHRAPRLVAAAEAAAARSAGTDRAIPHGPTVRAVRQAAARRAEEEVLVPAAVAVAARVPVAVADAAAVAAGVVAAAVARRNSP